MATRPAEPPPPTFGELLRRQRRRLDLTQDELAKRAGCARVTIHKLEADDMRPSKQLAEALAQALAIPAGEREAFVQLARGTPELEVITPQLAPASDSHSLYRRIFIGREAELKPAQAAFDACAAGQGSLLMIVGEPGIGKTALCERLAAYAVQRGGRALTGHCYEEGSLSVPYLPFIEALRPYVALREPGALRKELGAGAADVARIVPEVRERLTPDARAESILSLSKDSILSLSKDSILSPSKDSILSLSKDADDRYRLLDAVTSFLRAVAAAQPLLVVLEDLHWADRGTLDMLLYVARHLQGTRLLIAGTYRDVEVDRAHPLASALADLRRAGAFGRILLRGFGVDDVQRLMSAIAEQAVPAALAEAVHRQTEGNPLFIEEVIRYLSEAGLIARDPETGRWQAQGATPLSMQIPEGLRDVIGKRISRLSAPCNRLLSIAAVIGRDFELEILQAVAGMPEEPLLAGLEEALRVSVLAEQLQTGHVRYRFTHAFIRQTLYEELIAPRRIRLHQQVARALEQRYAARLAEHAAALAEHFAQSSDPADLTKAVEYGALAARQAMEVYAYGEAARLLEQALQVQDVLDPGDKAKRCDLLLALGEALIPSGEPKRVTDEVAAEAFALAESLNDSQRCTTASLRAIEGLQAFGAALGAYGPAFRLWAERADRYAKPGSADRVFADAAMAEAYLHRGHFTEQWNLQVQAVELSRRLENPAPFFYAATQIINVPRAPTLRQYRMQLVEELLSRPHEGVSLVDWSYLLRVCGLAYLEIGERERAEELWRELSELATQTRGAYVLLLQFTIGACLATLDGALEVAVENGARLVARADELGSPVMGRQFATTHTFRALLYLGRSAEAYELWQVAQQTAGLNRENRYAEFETVLLANIGRKDEAVQLLAETISQRTVKQTAEQWAIAPMANMLEAALILQDREAVSFLTGRLSDLGAFIDGWTFTCIGRHLAAAAVFLGDTAKAKEYNRQALAIATQVRFRPEIALIRLQMAELGLDDTDEAKRAEACAHLDFAIDEFRAMKMQPSLERALRLKGQLSADEVAD